MRFGYIRDRVYLCGGRVVLVLHEIFNGETRYDDDVVEFGRTCATRRSDDDRRLLVRLDDDLFGRAEPRLAERRYRRPRAGVAAGGRRDRGIARGGAAGRAGRGRLAVLFGLYRGRGHHGRGRGRRHEIARASAAARAGLPPVVPDRRVRAEHHRLVALAEAPVRVVGGEYAAERVPELRVEYRIDDRVERRVGVAEPREHFERGAGYARFAERRDDVDAEERHPAQQERAHDDAHRDGGLVVAHVVRRRVVVVVDGRQRGGRRGAGGRRARRRGQRPRHRADALHVLLRVTVQPAVDADHHHARYVKADARRYHRVRGRQVQRTRRHELGVALLGHLDRLGRLVYAQYADGHHGNERGQRPDARNAQQRIPPVQIRRVPEQKIIKKRFVSL